LIYTPGIFSKTPEIVELARETGEHDGIYATHMRSEGINVIKAIEEALEIGRAANVPVEISHFKIVAPFRFGQSTQTLQMVEDARKEGLDVAVDQYAYTASSTGINTMLPDWAVEGTREDMRRRLDDPETRKRMQQGIIVERRDQSGRKDLGYACISNFRADPSLNGKSLLEVARMRGADDSWEAQANVVLDIVSSGGASMVFHSMDEGDVNRIAQYANTSFASDSGVRAFGVGVPHPRGYGNNARVLAHFVRDTGLLRLEEAVRRMTSLPAQRFRMYDHGLLRPGMAADVAVFDHAKVNDASTFEAPHAYAEGFDYVLVNGVPVIDGGTMTLKRPGKVLYGPGRHRAH
jgi:N-acyl-D-amino-acid deacylase